MSEWKARFGKKIKNGGGGIINNNDKNEIKFYISNSWIGKNSGIEHYMHEFGGTDYFHMMLLIIQYYSKLNISRFNIKDIQYWFDIDYSNAKRKLRILDVLQNYGLLKYEYPVRDMINVYDLHYSFFPESNYTMLTQDEIMKVINNNIKKDKINKDKSQVGLTNANLLAVYFSIKSYINMQSEDLVAFPSERIIAYHTCISSKSVCSCINELKKLKLIDYINKGYDKKQKRNLGNVYTLHDDMSQQRLSKYIK